MQEWNALRSARYEVMTDESVSRRDWNRVQWFTWRALPGGGRRAIANTSLARKLGTGPANSCTGFRKCPVAPGPDFSKRGTGPMARMGTRYLEPAHFQMQEAPGWTAGQGPLRRWNGFSEYWRYTRHLQGAPHCGRAGISREPWHNYRLTPRRGHSLVLRDRVARRQQ